MTKQPALAPEFNSGRPVRTVRDLLREIPSDTMEVVDQACTAWAPRIRAQLVNRLLRWTLQHKSGRTQLNATVMTHWDRIGRPAEFDLPNQLAHQPIPDELWRAARLAVHAPKSRALADAARGLIPLFHPSTGMDWSGTVIDPSIARLTLDDARDLGDELLRLAAPIQPDGKTFDLVSYLLAVNTDLLGVYEWDGRERRDQLSDAPKGHITVYWGVVGLVASALGVSPRALAVVVLAHEMAHAYVHLGHDRDGKRWAGADHAASDHALKEALAQHYTHLICEELDGALPGLFEAYWTLLPKQPYQYQLHLPLLLDSTPEEVAATLAGLRQGPVLYRDFVDRLPAVGPVGDEADDGPESWRALLAGKRQQERS